MIFSFLVGCILRLHVDLVGVIIFYKNPCVPSPAPKHSIGKKPGMVASEHGNLSPGSAVGFWRFLLHGDRGLNCFISVNYRSSSHRSKRDLRSAGSVVHAVGAAFVRQFVAVYALFQRDTCLYPSAVSLSWPSLWVQACSLPTWFRPFPPSNVTFSSHFSTFPGLLARRLGTWCRSGHPPAIRIGRSIWSRIDAVKELVAAQMGLRHLLLCFLF